MTILLLILFLLGYFYGWVGIVIGLLVLIGRWRLIFRGLGFGLGSMIKRICFLRIIGILWFSWDSVLRRLYARGSSVMKNIYLIGRRYKIYVRIISVKFTTAMTLCIISHHYFFKFRTSPSIGTHCQHKTCQNNQNSTAKKIGTFSLLI